MSESDLQGLEVAEVAKGKEVVVEEAETAAEIVAKRKRVRRGRRGCTRSRGRRGFR